MENPIGLIAGRTPGLRVAMVTETYPPEVNGVARTVGLMAEGLRGRGHSVQLVRPRQHRAEHPAREKGFEEQLLRGLPIPRYAQLRLGLPAARRLARIWSVRRPDVVHVATEGPLGWSAIAAADKLGVPVATDFHTNFHAYSSHYGFAWLRHVVAGYLRRFHNRIGCTMVPTRELADALTRLGFERLRVVGRGVDSAMFSPAYRSRELRAQWGAVDTTLVAMCVSRLAPEKNLDVVLDAFRAMRRVRPGMKLVLVGDGPLRAQLARGEEGVILAGKRTGRELSEHYASADVFLFPSVTETFGNVTLEAMASGLAVVAYRYAAAREHLEHAQSALLPEFGDRDDFIGSAVMLAHDPELARALGRTARERAERLSWDRAFADFEAVLRDVSRTPPQPAAELQNVPG